MNASTVFSSLAELGKREPGPVLLAIGMFDGVHRGHRAVLDLAVNEGKAHDGLVAALTFPEHPAKSLRPGKEPPLLMDPSTKSEALLACGVDCVVMKPFDESLSEVPPGEFPSYLKKKIPGMVGICVGENFHFGKDREGDADFLKEIGSEKGLGICVADGVLEGGKPVSSSRIREALAGGEIKSVNRMLGFSYRGDGLVVSGNRLGREIGFPTLNLPWSPEARPAFGVYLVKASFPDGKTVHGVANYGVRPTVEDDGVEPLFEVHLLGQEDYSARQPGDRLYLDLLSFLRPEKKFESLDALKSQIARDKAEAVRLAPGI